MREQLRAAEETQAATQLQLGAELTTLQGRSKQEARAAEAELVRLQAQLRLSEQLQEDAEARKKEEKERVKRVIANMQARAKKEEKLKKDIAARKSRKKGARPSSVEGLRPGSTASTASSAGSNSRV